MPILLNKHFVPYGAKQLAMISGEPLTKVDLPKRIGLHASDQPKCYDVDRPQSRTEIPSIAVERHKSGAREIVVTTATGISTRKAHNVNKQAKSISK